MNTLVDQLLTILRAHSLVSNVRLLNYDETPFGKLEVKIRCRLTESLQLQIWLHHETAFQDYAYQLFAHDPIMRWDNAPHYPQISTSPHHFHNEDGGIYGSPLTGDPIADLRYVLQEVVIWLSQST